MRGTRALRLPVSLCLMATISAGAAVAARDRTPGFHEQVLQLPGMPATVIAADITGDGRDDLVVLVAYTGWGEEAEYEQAKFDDIEGLVEVMSIVSALLDRRELRVYPAKPDGIGFETTFAAVDLDTSVQTLQTGHPDEPLVAVTDDGVSAVRWIGGPEGPALALEPLLGAETRSADGRFYSEVDLLHDLDGDRIVDLLLPSVDGWAIYRGVAGGFAAEPSQTLEPASDRRSDGALGLPEVQDVTADGLPDLVVFKRGSDRKPLVFRNRGDATFDAPVEVELPLAAAGDEKIVYIGDLDGDGRATVLGREELERWEDPGMKQEIEQAKRPLFAYRFYHLGADLALEPEPYLDFQAIGYSFDGESDDDDDSEDEGEETGDRDADVDDDDEDVDIQLPGGFQDLNGDGRQDLVTIGLDFAVLKLIMQVLVTQRISLGMDFQTWCQQEDGSFRKVPGLDLSGKFKVNLRNVQIRHLSQFAGDFNGDGRADFVQLGRGKKVTIHHGGPGCTYPAQFDRKIKMDREPEHLGLVRILDLTGEGRSDLYVVHPLGDPGDGSSMPVRLDLYLSE